MSQDRKAAFLRDIRAAREVHVGEHVCGTPFAIVSDRATLDRLQAAHNVTVEEMMPGYWSVELAQGGEE